MKQCFVWVPRTHMYADDTLHIPANHFTLFCWSIDGSNAPTNTNARKGRERKKDCPQVDMDEYNAGPKP